MKACSLFFMLAGLQINAKAVKPVTYVDTYDEFQSAPIDLLGINSPHVGLYHGLQYTSTIANTNSLITGTNGGLFAQSQPNLAVPMAGQNSISSVYKGSKVKCFRLDSFFFGCSVRSSTQMASIAQGCAITVRGFQGNAMVGSAAFTFSPENILKQPLIFAKLSDEFKCVTNVTLNVGASATTPLTTVLKFDNLKHINYY